MMIRVAIICILLASVFAEENSTSGGAKDVGKGYGNGYGDHDGGYGGGHHGYGYGPHHGYGHGGHYGHHGPPRHRSFDTVSGNYCSVHGSFALALSRDGGNDGYGNNDGGYGNRDGGYGNRDGGYGHDHDRSRYFTRQFCRYSAAHSHKACSFCCRVAARVINTSPDDITSAIFSFDPVNPTGSGAGADDNYGDGSYRQKRESEGGRIRQCVCCAPKRPN
uniref:Uncharacterized protein n=1 Tax=Panagrolaimus sp. JU765 TaxID=591449 RepID=A0AC34Q2S9_9BILA